MTHEALREALTDTAEAIGALARRCLDDELTTYPKPGLVSEIDSGSHADMDAALLRRSAEALEPFFASLARAGARGAAMAELRRIGLAAEAAMLRATEGVNTHRGALFGLGLLCAAAGRQPRAPLGATVRDAYGEAILAGPLDPASHGAAAMRRHGVGGARGEAAAGFPTVYNIGLPALARGRSLAGDAAGRVEAVFALIAATDDTNLLHRGGSEGLGYAQAAAAGFLARGGVGAPGWQERAAGIHHAFVSRNLSPGGGADLLAMTLFVDRYEGAMP